MRRSTKILVAAAAALLAGLPTGWYFGSPWWTLWRIREAARAGDMAALASYVDWNAVRTGFWTETRTTWGRVPAKRRPTTPEGRKLIALARRVLVRPVENSLGADDVGNIRRWFAQFPVEAGGVRVGTPDHSDRPAVVHHGLDEFTVVDPRSSKDNGPVLTFRRHGLGWKLEGVKFGQQ